MIGFIIGAVVGGIVGVAVMCCCRVAGDADREMGGCDHDPDG